MEADQAGAGCFSADACDECEAADVCFDDGLNGLECQEAERVEDAAVCRASAGVPPAGSGGCTILDGFYEFGNVLGAGFEGGVFAGLPWRGGYVGDCPAPFGGEDCFGGLRSVAGALTSCAVRGVAAQGACVFESWRGA